MNLTENKVNKNTETLTQVREQLDYQDKLIIDLTDLIHLLEQKLNIVLVQEPELEQNVWVLQELLVPLADEIRDKNRRIQANIVTLNSIHRRIQL